MAVLKWKKDATTWIGFYLDAIRNRLRRDKNLSDVLDIQVARTNLEIVGDNNQTHYHDDRYKPLIISETQARTSADVIINTRIDALVTQANSFGDYADDIAQLTLEVNNLKYFIGPTDPGAVGNRLWFDTSNRVVKVCHNGGVWIHFGAVFL